MKIRLKCEKCKKVFYRYESAILKRNFCSYSCFQDYRYDMTKNHDFFEEINTENKSYWLGFLFADGNVSSKKRKQKSITIALSSKDEKHLNKFAIIFGSSVRRYYRDNYETCICSITSERMWNNLVEKGLFPNKTYIDNGEVFNFIPKKFKKDFIRGYFDGDGGISINKKTNGMCFHMIGTKKILFKIRDFIVENTFVKSPNLFPKKNVENLFILEWSGVHQLEAIRQFLYKEASVYLNRKFNRFQIIKKRYSDFIKNRENNFRGVGKSGNKFMAIIYNNGKSNYLGTFDKEFEAAKAYDEAVVRFKKPLYRLNFPIEK